MKNNCTDRGLKEEITHLLHAKEDLNLRDDVPLTVITWDYEDDQEVNGKRMRFVPL